jgi:trimethylamine:corrinoid methyltransferase-like protein
MYKTIKEAIKAVEASVSSVLTKEDVLKLLRSIKQQQSELSDSETANRVTEAVMSVVSEIGINMAYIEYGSEEYELEGSTVSLTNVRIDYEAVELAVKDAVQSVI